MLVSSLSRVRCSLSLRLLTLSRRRCATAPAGREQAELRGAISAAIQRRIAAEPSLLAARVPIAELAHDVSASMEQSGDDPPGGVASLLATDKRFELQRGPDGLLAVAVAPSVAAEFAHRTPSSSSEDGDALDASIAAAVRYLQHRLAGEGAAVPIVDVYQLLDAEQRVAVRQHFRTLAAYFMHRPQHFVVRNGRVCFCGDAGAVATQEVPAASPPPQRRPVTAREASLGSAREAAGLPPPPSPSRPAGGLDAASAANLTKAPLFRSFFFDPETRELIGEIAAADIPPPPEVAPNGIPIVASPGGGCASGTAGLAATGAAADSAGVTSAASAGGGEDGVVAGVSVQDFTHVIPTFFVPAVELLREMPGYTEDHLAQYFSNSKTVQTVRIGRHNFVRVHGGYGRLDLQPTERAAAIFERFSIDPQLSPAFEATLRERWGPGTFVPLQRLLEASPPEAVAKLPYAGPFSLLYFAQLQHIYAFAPENGGAVSLLPPNFLCNLTPITTPVPAVTCELLTVLGSGPVPLDILERERLSSYAVATARRYFGTLEQCLLRHEGLFRIDHARGMMVHTVKQLHQAETKKLSLEQQLEQAVLERDKKKIRRLRRKLHMIRNPNNPLLDNEKLAKAIYDFLPPKRHVGIKHLARNLPFELADLLPTRQLRFFKSFPGLFNLYEWRQPTHWYLSRAEVEIPPGALRQEYSEEEVLRIVAGTLHHFGGEKPLSNVSLRLPLGAREYAKKHHGGLLQLLRKHGEYFSLLFESGREDASFCTIKLLAHPPVTAADGGTGDGDDGGGDLGDDDAGADGEGA